MANTHVISSVQETDPVTRERRTDADGRSAPAPVLSTVAPPLLHIGYHKTGTSWLQLRLFCRADLGFCEPWGGRSHVAIDQFVLANPFRFDAAAAREQFMPAVREAAGKSLIPVLTHEDLCGYPVHGRYYGAQVADRLAETFPGAKVLIGVREQRSALLSHYGQYIHQGKYGSIEKFIGTREHKAGFAPICRLDHFEFHLLVGHYRRLFGAGNVLVLPIEFLKEDGRRYVETIYEFLGMKPPGYPDMKPSNVGWGRGTLIVKRWLNRVNFGLPDWERPKQSVGYHLVNRLCRVTDRIVPAWLNQRTERPIRRYIAERCDGYFCESNRELGRMIGMDLGKYGYMV